MKFHWMMANREMGPNHSSGSPIAGATSSPGPSPAPRGDSSANSAVVPPDSGVRSSEGPKLQATGDKIDASSNVSNVANSEAWYSSAVTRVSPGRPAALDSDDDPDSENDDDNREERRSSDLQQNLK